VNYRASIPQDLPSSYIQVEFSVAGGLGEVTLSVLVEVEGHDPWVGLFRSLGYREVNEVFTWSEGSMLLAVSKGYGHYVRADDPSARTEVPIFPIRYALRHSTGLLVLGGFDRLCGIDGHSVRWVSSLVASDWLEDVRLEDQFVTGRGNVPSTGGWEPFRVSLADGTTDTPWKLDI
jgi:hypothetical protein